MNRSSLPYPTAAVRVLRAPVNKARYSPGLPKAWFSPAIKAFPRAAFPVHNYFEPRLGIAWAPKFLPNTSIRSAVGLFTQPIDYSHFTHAGDNFPWSPTYSFSRYDPTVGEINLNDVWANYAPVGGVSPFPPFNAQGPGLPGYTPPVQHCLSDSRASYLGYSLQPGFKLGQTASWNFSIEHQLKSNGFSAPPTWPAKAGIRTSWSIRIPDNSSAARLVPIAPRPRSI